MPHFKGDVEGLEQLKPGMSLTLDHVLRATHVVKLGRIRGIVAVAYYHHTLNEWEIIFVRVGESWDNKMGGVIIDRRVYLASKDRRYKQLMPHIKDVMRQHAGQEVKP